MAAPLFGSLGNTNAFGASNAAPAATTAGGGGLFSTTAQASGGSFNNSSFGKPAAPTGIFGNPQANQQQPQNKGLFGQTAQQEPPKPLFGQSAQQDQQNQQANPSFGQSQPESRIWSESQVQPRQRTIPEQMKQITDKWFPQNANSSFHAYLYNQVDPNAAAFYRPDPSENEEKWEEALRKAPTPGSIPVLVMGFHQLGTRIVNQEKHLRILQGRLHEINNGLSSLLRKHDLEISTRAAECRRRHIRLTQKCLALATKTQILRNRGYALDGAEEELAAKLKKLERDINDPRLNGRGEEIWARMVNVRERGEWLQKEFERAGRTVEDSREGKIDEEVLKTASQILMDYDKQLTHLSEELKSIKTEFEDWQKGKPGSKEDKERARE